MEQDQTSNETSQKVNKPQKSNTIRYIKNIIISVLKSLKMPILFIIGYLILGNILYFISPSPDIPQLLGPRDNQTNVGLSTSLSWIGGNPNLPGIYLALQLAKLDFNSRVHYNIYIYNESGSLIEHGLEESDSGPKELTYIPKTPIQQDSRYSWIVKAKNGYGKESQGTKWQFETIKGSPIDLQIGKLFNDSNGCLAKRTSANCTSNNEINISYTLLENGYVRYNIPLTPGELSKLEGLKFLYKGAGSRNTLELKLAYKDSKIKDTTFQELCKNSTSNARWVEKEILFKDLHWGWNEKNQSFLGDLDKNRVANMEFAISNKPDYGDDYGTTSGWVMIKDLRGIV